MNTPKRVVHLTTVHHPYDPRIYHKECLSLHQAGYQVTLIAPEDGTATFKDKPINMVPTKKYGNRLARMVFGTWKTYRKAKGLNAAVYHVHDPELLPVAWLLKKKNNVVIYDIHEDYVTSIMQKDYMKKPVKKIIASTYKLAESFFSRKLALCLAEKYYKEMYPNGTCILNYPTMNEKLMNHQRDSGALERKLLYTGNVSLVRGAHIHAKIPLSDKDVSVHFVGKCPGELANTMYEIAGKEKNSLKIIGIDRFIEKEEIEAMYLKHNWLAGIAIFPPTKHYMKKELTKFFEYMSAGLPIICSNFPLWKNFVETYGCGIAVDPYNETAIKEAIAYLKANPDKAKQMGENGKKAVIEELNWQTEEKKLINWYETLLG